MPGPLPADRRARGPIAALLAVAVATGCAHGARAGRPPDVRAGELAGRGGFVSFGPSVRLRDDTPPLTPIVEAERAAVRASLAAHERPSLDAYGPAGADGRAAPLFFESGPCASPYGCAPVLVPVGAVPPGLRPPAPPPAGAPGGHVTPWAPSPSSDVARHRPGLSTGSGVFGRP